MSKQEAVRNGFSKKITILPPLSSIGGSQYQYKTHINQMICAICLLYLFSKIYMQHFVSEHQCGN